MNYSYIKIEDNLRAEESQVYAEGSNFQVTIRHFDTAQMERCRFASLFSIEF